MKAWANVRPSYSWMLLDAHGLHSSAGPFRFLRRRASWSIIDPGQRGQFPLHFSPEAHSSAEERMADRPSVRCVIKGERAEHRPIRWQPSNPLPDHETRPYCYTGGGSKHAQPYPHHPHAVGSCVACCFGMRCTAHGRRGNRRQEEDRSRDRCRRRQRQVVQPVGLGWRPESGQGIRLGCQVHRVQAADRLRKEHRSVGH